MTLKQKYVCMSGKDILIDLDENLKPFEIIDKSDSLDAEINNTVLSIKPYNRGRKLLSIKNKNGVIFKINLSVFAEKEVFLITALSCNHHTGWNPLLHDRFPHHLCCGADKSGNAFKHVLNMENILHKNNLPITWMIDEITASENYNFFYDNIRNFNDEISYMPSSFSHFNPVNFNIDKTLEETINLCKNGIEKLEDIFKFKITSMAIDQFIGSVGTNFTNAAEVLGINALWGVGLDHGTCDTSMYHGGCPWNAYRPSKDNFRIPGKNPHHLWIFQWTFRDLINTVNVPGGASGSVMFSTDVDDIVCCQLTKYQKDYYHKLTEEVLKNRDYNDMLEITIHQEDHDSWHKEGLDYYDNFFSNMPEGLTPATLCEVAQWLELKYPFPKSSEQVLKLNDPIKCKQSIIFPHKDIIKPDNWLDNNAKYPPHIFYYNDEMQIVFRENSNIPFRYIDYRKNYLTSETDVYPAEKLPEIIINSLKYENKVLFNIESNSDYEGFPVAIWTDKTPPENSIKIVGGFIYFIDLKKGRNKNYQ